MTSAWVEKTEIMRVSWTRLSCRSRAAVQLLLSYTVIRARMDRVGRGRLSADATRPARAKVLSIWLNPEEFDALHRHAEQLEIPVSALVRGWILAQLRTDSDTSPLATVDRIAREVEQLRRRLVS